MGTWHSEFRGLGGRAAGLVVRGLGVRQGAFS